MPHTIRPLRTTGAEPRQAVRWQAIGFAGKSFDAPEAPGFSGRDRHLRYGPHRRSQVRHPRGEPWRQLGGLQEQLLPSPGVRSWGRNSHDCNSGRLIEEAFRRRLLEVLFDGKPEAVTDITAAAANYKASEAKDRERLTVPADPAMVTKLARRYFNDELGPLNVLRSSGPTKFIFSKWRSTVASRQKR